MVTFAKMPELRLNLLTREWVIIQTERAKKPEEFRQRREKRYVPEVVESCPFCPGNENKTPPEIMRLPADGKWRVRVTPNKFAALLAEGERVRINEGLKHLVSGIGKHEVIIESAKHNVGLAQLGVEEIMDVLNVYKLRFTEVFKDPRVEHAIIFKNHGLASGTTIQHPHSQLIGTPVTPLQVRNRMDEAMRYFDNTGDCLVCAILRDEIKDGKRIILDTKHFVTFIPYAALSAFHTWIFPKRHAASFAFITDEEIEDLAYNLKMTLSKLYFGLDDPDFNYVVRSNGPFRFRSEYLHWYISIVPRLIQTAGFELGSGMYMNASIPEEVAAFMRGVKVS
jgi:UDPglucose--hexose-1-phosphate uridylyltransferase